MFDVRGNYEKKFLFQHISLFLAMFDVMRNDEICYFSISCFMPGFFYEKL